MNEYANALKEKLTSLIGEMSANSSLYVKNPKTDFTRKRKFSFDDVVKLLITMGGKSIYSELLEAYRFDSNTATASALIQQRAKILPEAFEFLLYEFTASCTNINTYQGYRLLAVDGSSLNIATDPTDTLTYFQTNPEVKGYNLMHLNALFDLCYNLYVDAVVQPSKLIGEDSALVSMVNRSRIEGKTIVVADRGYESYNNFANIERKGWNYVIRVKDIDSQCSMLYGLKDRLPGDGEFDIRVQFSLTKKSTNYVKNNPHIYKRLSSTSTFDFLDLHENKYYPISFRVVRFMLPSGEYETVITNLDQTLFSSHEIKFIYKMRWGIETSFRDLKHTVGLNYFHSRKREFIVQEIFARLIMYNFAEMMTSHVIISNADTKHDYQANFSIVVCVCKHFLRLHHSEPPPDVEALIRKNILPIRLNRSYPRKTRPKSAVSFVYRIA